MTQVATKMLTPAQQLRRARSLARALTGRLFGDEPLPEVPVVRAMVHAPQGIRAPAAPAPGPRLVQLPLWQEPVRLTVFPEAGLPCLPKAMFCQKTSCRYHLAEGRELEEDDFKCAIHLANLAPDGQAPVYVARAMGLDEEVVQREEKTAYARDPVLFRKLRRMRLER